MTCAHMSGGKEPPFLNLVKPAVKSDLLHCIQQAEAKAKEMFDGMGRNQVKKVE